MKKFTVIIFALLFALLPLNVLAEGTPETIDLWGSDRYTFAFDLTEDFQAVKSTFVQGEEIYDEEIGESYDTSVPGRKFFGIKAEKAGYYAIIYKNDRKVVYDCNVGKSDDENIEGIFKESIAIFDENNQECGIIFKMKNSEKEYAFVDEYTTGEYSIKYTYLGDDILSAKSAGALVYNLDAGVVEDYEDDKCINVTEMYPYVNLKFSLGETVKINAFVHTKNLNKIGTVDADITVLDKEFKISVEFIKYAELVESITLPKEFTPSCTISYNGVITYYNYPDYVLIKPKNGEAIKAKRGEQIILSNGRSYDVWIEYSTESESELVSTVSFIYALNGNNENEIEVTPTCKNVFSTFSDIFSDSKIDFKYGIKILQGKAEDATTKDGLYFMGALPHHIIGAVRYYAFYGKYLHSAAVVALSLTPLILLIAVIILVKHNKKAKK